ncbi:MAG: GntR family transcriptional regulator [Thermodesulfobacteriota bacterium]
MDESPVPLYFQIKSIMRSKILSGELKQNDCLPSEAELCKEYSVSRGTLRQALSELIREGLIYRARGKGTFVADGAGLRRLSYKGTIENLIVSASEGETRVLEYKEVSPTPKVAMALELDEVEAWHKVFQLDVLFSIPKGPSRYSMMYFPARIGKMISAEVIEKARDIILLVEEKLQMRLHHAEQTMDVALAQRPVCQYLSVQEGTPVFLIQRRFIARDRSPAFVSFSYCRPDLYEFRIELTRT